MSETDGSQRGDGWTDPEDGSGESAALAELRARTRQFINNEVIPAEPVLDRGGEESTEKLSQLKQLAKERGLWALGHPEEVHHLVVARRLIRDPVGAVPWA